ncbi:hypothetical protein SAMN04488029_0578 [Reichenbachiella faecimaris]|uniref:Uncharacterized protein n=1 Tax=Reichenbachiella faecimaris TaxID=692418 RepID=A0A1W2G6E5_REIFA|nr:hypothetical protein [Reichenbachiella faecimaris]SMD32235.1 hypothetical protein SAMN04488029_0578 [Reichenbachiella faecimaris]
MNKITLAGVSTFVSIITALLVTYNTIKVNQFNNELAKQKSDRELNFKIYESVTDALESENEKRILAVKVIVSSMASDNMKTGFLEILKSGEDKIYSNQEAQTYTNPLDKPSVKASEQANYKFWNYDIFWCSTSGLEAETLASEVKFILEQNGFKGRIRVRILPESVTKRPGMGVPATYEIRVDAGEEMKNADKITELITKSTSNIAGDFNVFQVSQKAKIPGYVSLFFCP